MPGWLRQATWVRFALGEIERDPALRPVLATGFLYAVAFSTFWTYVGIFSVERLGARPSQVGVLFLLSAAPAGAANYLSGELSDRVGRRRLVSASFAATTLVVLGLIAASDRLVAGFCLIVAAGVVGAPAYTLGRTIVADVIAPGRREAAYATLRVAENVGIAAGPPLAGLLILAGGWTAFLLGIAGVGVAGYAVSARFLPATGGHPSRVESLSRTLGMVARDRRFQLLLGSTLLGYFAFAAFETVLPVVAVSSYGLSASSWGALVAVNPVLVLLFQMRVTRRLEHVALARRLAGSLIVMGSSFLILLVATTTAAVVAVIVVFVLGEMVWSPAAQTLAAELAPRERRGAYLGAFSATTGPAWMLAPFIALQIRGVAGDVPMWCFVAGAGVLAALLGVAACRAATAGRSRPVVGGSDATTRPGDA